MFSLSHSRKLRTLDLRSVRTVIELHLHLSLKSYILEYGILESEFVRSKILHPIFELLQHSVFLTGTTVFLADGYILFIRGTLLSDKKYYYLSSKIPKLRKSSELQKNYYNGT